MNELSALDFSEGTDHLLVDRDSMVVAYETRSSRRCLFTMTWVKPGMPKIREYKYTFFTEEDEADEGNEK